MTQTDITDWYDELGRLLGEERIYEDPSMDFKTICRRIGAPPRVMDRLLRRELGVGGDTLIVSFRHNVG